MLMKPGNMHGQNVNNELQSNSIYTVSPYEANTNEYAMQQSGARSGSSYKNT